VRESKDKEDGPFNHNCRDCCLICYIASASPPNNTVGKVGIHPHTGRQCDRKVGNEPHQETCNHACNGSGSHILLLDLFEAFLIGWSKNATIVLIGNTWPARVGEDARVDRKDVGHREECRRRAGKFGRECTTPLLYFEEFSDEGVADSIVQIFDELHGLIFVVLDYLLEDTTFGDEILVMNNDNSELGITFDGG